MGRLHSLLVLCLVFFGLVHAKSAVGDRLLVVLEDGAEKDLYSILWHDLEARSFQLSFESPKNEHLSLFRHGDLAFDHVILTPPKSKGYGPALTPKLLLDYVNAGGNVLLCLSSDGGTPSSIASLLLEFDIALPQDRQSVVVDHFNYDTNTASDKHDVLVLKRPSPPRSDTVDFFGGDGYLVLPKPVGQVLGNTSPLLSAILKAPSTAYTHNPKDESQAAEDVFASGSQICLVSTMQARNSARFTVLGSLDMLQDKWLSAKPQVPGSKTLINKNRDFAKQLTEWTFKEVGVLKVGNVVHYELSSGAVSDPSSSAIEIARPNPGIYRIKKDVFFSIDLSIWSSDHFAPFTLPANDALQLEFSMLSPFHRLSLQPSTTTPNSTVYSTTFRTPDQHGIFAFRVNYKRPFLTNVEEKRQVTVRHFAHDEWPRSWRISGAWPWIAGLWSVVGGFLAFVVLWLYCEPPDQVGKKMSSS